MVLSSRGRTLRTMFGSVMEASLRLAEREFEHKRVDEIEQHCLLPVPPGRLPARTRRGIQNGGTGCCMSMRKCCP